MKIDLRTGNVIINNQIIHLTKNELRAVSVLSKSELTTLEEIYEAIYSVKPKNLKTYEKRSIYTLIARIRKKFQNNIQILSVNDYGYMLKFLDK